MKKVLIAGCEGQDGRLLIESVSANQELYFGIGRKRCITNIPGLEDKTIAITDREAVASLIQQVQPDEIYFLAAFHHSSEQNTADETELFRQSYEVQVFSLVNFLEALRASRLASRLFYACSSHVFAPGESKERLDETTVFDPRSIYGMSKLSGLLACRYYRAVHGVYASVGILFNHESGFRAPTFLSKRIVKGALDIRNGSAQELVVGDLSASVDWGYAPDYVEAMRAILRLDKADDFVIASGEKRSVSEFVETTFRVLGLDPSGKVREDRSRLARPSLNRIGNPEKLNRCTGWRPTVDFEGMIRKLVAFEEGGLNG